MACRLQECPPELLPVNFPPPGKCSPLRHTCAIMCNVYVYIYIYVYVYKQICIYIYIYIYIYMCVCIYIYIYIYISKIIIHLNHHNFMLNMSCFSKFQVSLLSLLITIYIYICICVYIYIHICLYTYTYTCLYQRPQALISIFTPDYSSQTIFVWYEDCFSHQLNEVRFCNHPAVFTRKKCENEVIS